MTEDDQTEEYSEPRGFATRLVRTIRDYWRQRGYDVNVDIKQIWRGQKRYNTVVSDLVNGLPRDWRNHRRARRQ
jgi:hypothetical protein